MRYAGMPAGMWMLFRNSFRKNLGDVLGYDRESAGEITEKAGKDYRMLIRKLPEFEKGDRFKMNIVNCAVFSAFCLHIRPCCGIIVSAGSGHKLSPSLNVYVRAERTA